MCFGVISTVQIVIVSLRVMIIEDSHLFNDNLRFLFMAYVIGTQLPKNKPQYVA